MDHPKDIGDRSTLAIMLALREGGYAIYVPFGENTRYDLLLDDEEQIRRVQCKTGRLRNGVVIFPVCSSYAHHPNPKDVNRDYHGQVDVFAIYCRETRRVYVVPIEELPCRRVGALRVEPTKNGQDRRVRFAAPYEVARVVVD